MSFGFHSPKRTITSRCVLARAAMRLSRRGERAHSSAALSESDYD